MKYIKKYETIENKQIYTFLLPVYFTQIDYYLKIFKKNNINIKFYEIKQPNLNKIYGDIFIVFEDILTGMSMIKASSFLVKKEYPINNFIGNEIKYKDIPTYISAAKYNI